MDVSALSYMVAFVIYHLGNDPTSGHYRAALSTPGTSLGFSTGWKFRIFDDSQAPRLATAADFADISTNAYLIGLVRYDAS